MTDTSLRFHHAVVAKTAIGQDEIKTRARGLSPMLRRLLILVDGKRTGQELASFVSGHAVADLLDELIQQQCIELVTPSSEPGATPAAPSGPDKQATHEVLDAAPAVLPPPESRSALDLAMARNFMTNTVNTIFQPNTRLTLLKAIQACQTSAEARAVYPRWAEAMATSTIGAKRLAEFQDKLFKVL
ncbi:hypothetical protein [Rhodoferax sp. BLA1]|uniref:hypothetical protein n=1 Tax=Rhodoferax sp. BLA1 TaxID=2576062 RepID=UPI0015D19434|nr:hypothetical protein [Rhodoferax sp. BLA1]